MRGIISRKERKGRKEETAFALLASFFSRSQVVLGDAITQAVALPVPRERSEPKFGNGSLDVWHDCEVQLRGKMRSQVQLVNEKKVAQYWTATGFSTGGTDYISHEARRKNGGEGVCLPLKPGFQLFLIAQDYCVRRTIQPRIHINPMIY